MTTIKMVAPALQAGMNVTISQTGNSYTSDANGLVSVALNDVNQMEAAGFLPLGIAALPTLALSTAAGVYVNPVSTIAAIALLAVPAVLGQTTRLVAVSTGNFTITSSGCTILDQKGAACTVLTCNTGTMSLVSVGSTLYQIMDRSLYSNSSNAVVFGIASS